MRRRALTDDLVRLVTQAAFQVQSPDRSLRLRIRVGLLAVLPGVGVPVASAVLALVEPEEYGIIDVRAWEQVFGAPKSKFSDTDYLRYMRRVWKLAEELGWAPQRVEWCIWQLTESACVPDSEGDEVWLDSSKVSAVLNVRSEIRAEGRG